MTFRSNIIVKINVYFFAALFVLATGILSSIQAQGFSVTPGKVELQIPPGSERTTVLTVDYAKEPGKELSNIRVIAKSEDWGVSPNGEVISADAGTMPRSATSWMIYSPAEFTIAPGTTQNLRVTVSVPEGTKPGDYYTAIYLQDRNPPPPPGKDTKLQVSIRYRFYALIYVMVPDLTRKGEIANLESSVEQGKAVVKATLKNTGNSHVRGIHSVEFRDEADRIVAVIPKKQAMVLLGESEMTLKLSLDQPLPAGNYNVVYTIDFGKESSIQVGKTMLEVSSADAAAMVKEKPTENQPDVTPVSTISTPIMDAASTKPNAETKKP